MNAVKVKLAPHQWDALFSICFNVGTAFARSTCIKRLNAGDAKGAAEAILKQRAQRVVLAWAKARSVCGMQRMRSGDSVASANCLNGFLVAHHFAPPSAWHLATCLSNSSIALR